MKILVFYRQKSEHARAVEDYLSDLVRLHDVREENIKTINPDTRNGSADANLYDVVSFPGLVVTDNFGQFVHSWSGEMPLMDELMSYIFSLQ